MRSFFLGLCVAVCLGCGARSGLGVEAECEGQGVSGDNPIEGGGGIGGVGGSGGVIGGMGGVGGATCEPVYDCTPTPSEVAGKAQCDDGEQGTIDRCIQIGACGGVCIHLVGQCDHYDSFEIQQTRCDDGSPCTKDRCSAINACFNQPIQNGSECPGGECQSGVCVPD